MRIISRFAGLRAAWQTIRGRLIVGVDLKKDTRKLVLAYNDAAGVTAAFNLNLLERINREIGGTSGNSAGGSPLVTASARSVPASSSVSRSGGRS